MGIPMVRGCHCMILCTYLQSQKPTSIEKKNKLYKKLVYYRAKLYLTRKDRGWIVILVTEIIEVWQIGPKVNEISTWYLKNWNFSITLVSSEEQAFLRVTSLNLETTSSLAGGELHISLLPKPHIAGASCIGLPILY